MKPPKTKRNRTRSRLKPPSESEVQFVISTLAMFGARPELVPDGAQPEAWEAWRVARAKEVAVPLRVLDHAAATLLMLLDCMPPERGPPGAKADPAVAEALRIAALLGISKIEAARRVVRLRAWRERCEKADRRAKQQAEGRREGREQAAIQEDIPDGIRGEIEAWRTLNDERSFKAEEREKAYDAHGDPDAWAALETAAKRLVRAMEPSRRTGPTKLKR